MSNESDVKLLEVSDVEIFLGIDFPRNDERAKQLALFIIEDLYDRGSYSVKENSVLEKMKADFILQLQCEGRK